MSNYSDIHSQKKLPQNLNPVLNKSNSKFQFIQDKVSYMEQNEKQYNKFQSAASQMEINVSRLDQQHERICSLEEKVYNLINLTKIQQTFIESQEIEFNKISKFFKDFESAKLNDLNSKMNLTDKNDLTKIRIDELERKLNLISNQQNNSVVTTIGISDNSTNIHEIVNNAILDFETRINVIIIRKELIQIRNMF